MKTKRIIPSHNSIRYCALMLREFQYKTEREAMVYHSANLDKEHEQLALQAHDMGQVAQFLEQYILKPNK